MAVKDALLALLSSGPRYGYQLKAEFDAVTGEGWPLNIGQVYSTLQRLERDGLVSPDGSPDEDGRQPYLLTSEGRDALAKWFNNPVATPISGRDEVSMKILVAIATEGVPALEVLRQQRTAAMGDLQNLTAQKAAAIDSDLANRLHIDRLVLMAESQIRWLDLVEQRLEDSGEQHEMNQPTARLNGRDEQ